MSTASEKGSVALLPEAFEVRPDAVDKAAPAARAAAARISQVHRRRTGPAHRAEQDPNADEAPTPPDRPKS